MGMEENGEYPSLRTEREIVSLMEGLADRCSMADQEDEAPHMFKEALSLMLEARVPRMPEDPDDLARMLEAGREEEAYTQEEVWAHLDAHGRAFQAWLARYRQMISMHGWNSAAAMLMPSGDPGAPRWGGEPCRMSVRIEDDGSGKARVIRGEDAAHGESRIAGLAMLAAIMRAHAAWHDIWRR